MEYAVRLLNFRAKHNLTQADLADILGVCVTMVHRYERNYNKPSAKNKIIYEKKMNEYEEVNQNVEM